jgi:hypothetical protein
MFGIKHHTFHVKNMAYLKSANPFMILSVVLALVLHNVYAYQEEGILPCDNLPFSFVTTKQSDNFHYLGCKNSTDTHQ